jgi:hypothetical protein
VQAISQPIHSSDWALNRAREAAEALKADFAVIDQTKLHTELQVCSRGNGCMFFVSASAMPTGLTT